MTSHNNDSSSTMFIMDIERLHSRNRGLTYLETIAAYCEQHGLEIESVAKVIKRSPIAAKMEAECQELRILKPTAKLPF